MGFLQAGVKGPIVPPPAVPAPAPPSKAVTTTIADNAGLGEWGEMAVMFCLALLLGVVVIGITLFALRKAFGSTDEMQGGFDKAERMAFDLVKRKFQAIAAIDGAKLQIAAVIATLNKVR